MAARNEDKYTSIRMVRFLMRIVGFWTSETKTEERILKGAVGYTFFTILLALWIETTELYFSINDFYILALIHMGICFCCFDNYLGLLNMHAAGQFKLLQHRLESILERIGQIGTLESFDEKVKQAIYEEVRGCVVQHQELIWYSEKMEGIFMYTTLCQLLVSSVMICVAGFQMFLSRGTLVRRLIFIAHTNGSVCQLFVVTFTAHHLLDESRAVGNSAYGANWEVLSHRDNRGIRNAVLMMIVRAMRACSISAGGFFPVSLETFMTVMSTAASYFALLRNFIDE